MWNLIKNLFAKNKGESNQSFCEDINSSNDVNLRSDISIEETSSEKGKTVTILLPKLSENMSEAKITHYNYEVGDVVKPGDIICEIETDKTMMEFESIYSGRIIYLNRSSSIAVNEKIIILEEV